MEHKLQFQNRPYEWRWWTPEGSEPLEVAQEMVEMVLTAHIDTVVARGGAVGAGGDAQNNSTNADADGGQGLASFIRDLVTRRCGGGGGSGCGTTGTNPNNSVDGGG